ncbi:MAG: hypothetical protein K0Q57_110 [Gammaproteobacteria bacterium]|jgi:hypothetical protein|nr:hypothetical protein [Gammaproteobacteria bacterium]
MFRASLIFHRFRTSFVRSQPNKQLTLEEKIASYKKEIERVKQNPRMKKSLEESEAEAQAIEKDPNFKPAIIKPDPDWVKKFKEKEEETRKHSAY